MANAFGHAPPSSDVPSPKHDDLSTQPLGRLPIRHIVDEFIEQLPRRLKAMRYALQFENWNPLAEQARWLQWNGRTVGFDCLVDSAREVEDAARRHEPESVLIHLQALASLAARIGMTSRPAALSEIERHTTLDAEHLIDPDNVVGFERK